MAKDFRQVLITWLGDVTRWGKNKYLLQEEAGSDPKDGTQVRIRVYLYTDGNRYSIVATPDYLGCIVSARKPRPGEDWTRGNDLADGRFCKETWHKILADIVSYELKTISDYILNPPQHHGVKEETLT